MKSIQAKKGQRQNECYSSVSSFLRVLEERKWLDQRKKAELYLKGDATGVLSANSEVKEDLRVGTRGIASGGLL